ncbi:MAG: helix-turn-helix transcriptional regulator [Clostridiales bacterium]|jgi:transcriptional regulator with XRE-family HTH domain|nr:helix-turn-helix transcriptional regulator [Clostridiales bacterium]
MGMYRLGDIIRMTRKSLSITQEQLSDGICSVETLSRIETGKQNPSRDNYELLMQRMGRIRERAYSMLSVSDFKVLEKMRQFEDYIRLYDYKQAEIVLQEIKKYLGDSILDKQFLIRAESIVNYRLKRISVEEFLDGLQEAILLTIPRYGSISLANWPLSMNETGLLVNISTAYAENDDYRKAIDILEEANRAMNQSYMDEQQRINFQINIKHNLSKWYGLVGEHKQAIEVAREGIDICKKYKLGNALANFLYNITWNKEQMIDKGLLPAEDRKECLTDLKQAFYIASAMQQPFIVQFLGEHIGKKYNVKIGLPIDSR